MVMLEDLTLTRFWEAVTQTRERAQKAAQQNRESALDTAHAAYIHAYRFEHLEEQTDAWHQAQRLTEYVTAVRNHTTSLPRS
ncbi:hypothetical protein [Streptomyces sp. NPDC020607]|uniref:hypothetical protein n=1 Tax=Streptomyces sp. NPDC020607 TaxID=3365082 RepID=UPI0037BD39A9